MRWLLSLAAGQVETAIVMNEGALGRATREELRVGAAGISRTSFAEVDVKVIEATCESVSCSRLYGHFTTGGIDERMLATLPPVLRPNVVPRS